MPLRLLSTTVVLSRGETELGIRRWKSTMSSSVPTGNEMTPCLSTMARSSTCLTRYSPMLWPRYQTFTMGSPASADGTSPVWIDLSLPMFHPPCCLLHARCPDRSGGTRAARKRPGAEGQRLLGAHRGRNDRVI